MAARSAAPLRTLCNGLRGHHDDGARRAPGGWLALSHALRKRGAHGRDQHAQARLGRQMRLANGQLRRLACLALIVRTIETVYRPGRP